MIIFKENNFFLKIKRCFYKIKEKLFGKRKDFENSEITETGGQNNQEDSFKQEIKVDTSEIDALYLKKDFLKEIDGNAELLEMLSIDRLKKLENYYDEVIKQNELKIKKTA